MYCERLTYLVSQSPCEFLSSTSWWWSSPDENQPLLQQREEKPWLLWLNLFSPSLYALQQTAPAFLCFWTSPLSTKPQFYQLSSKPGNQTSKIRDFVLQDDILERHVLISFSADPPVPKISPPILTFLLLCPAWSFSTFSSLGSGWDY